MNDDDLDPETEQLVGQGGKAFPLSIHPSKFDGDVLSRDPSKVPETLQERLVPALGARMRLREYRQESYPAHLLLLLPCGRKVPSQNSENGREHGNCLPHGILPKSPVPIPTEFSHIVMPVVGAIHHIKTRHEIASYLTVGLPLKTPIWCTHPFWLTTGRNNQVFSPMTPKTSTG